MGSGITDIGRLYELAPMTQFRVSGVRFLRTAAVDRAGRVFGLRVSPGPERGSLAAFDPGAFVEILGSVDVKPPREFIEEEEATKECPQPEPPPRPAPPRRAVRSRWDWLHRHFETAGYAVLETPAGDDPNKFRRRIGSMMQMSPKNSASLYHWHTHVYGRRVLLWRGEAWAGCADKAAKKPSFTWSEIMADTNRLLRILSEPAVTEAKENGRT